jgi:aspartate aminotransferase
MQQEGIDVVNFAAGEPDFDTPDFIKNAAIEAIQNGFTKYTPSSGILELKKAICEKFYTENSLRYAIDQIIISAGAKHSLYNTIQVLIQNGEEVIILSPYWVSYPEMVRLAGGTPLFITPEPKNNFKVTAQQLKAAITPKTKLLILNSPSNPTGVVYNKKELEDIAEICIAKGIFVISDEIYEKIIYDDLKAVSIGSLNKDIFDLTITVNGVSKSFSMTGWRIGYLGGPKEVVEAIERLQDHSTSNPCSISQKAALAALAAPPETIEYMRKEFQKRRDYVAKSLDDIPCLSYIRPQGAFYVFCDITKTKLDSSALAERLLEEAKVAVIPGEGFGWSNFIRISFATSLEMIGRGMDRIKKWLNN